MCKPDRKYWISAAGVLVASGLFCPTLPSHSQSAATIGREVSVSRHLQDGEEFLLPTLELIHHGKLLFSAVWTDQEGGGRPLTKGTGNPLADLTQPLVFPRNFNRISAPDANSCAGCHNQPFGLAGGGGDIVANVFVLGHRFDFATFDRLDLLSTKSSFDELGRPVSAQNVGNSRATIGMFGAGYVEMLARQITADLQGIRDRTGPGAASDLVSKGIHFGRIVHGTDGSWDTSAVEGLPATSLIGNPPNLIIRPFHQAGRVVSLREFSNNAFNHHHGIQTTERFGLNTDPDGDGFVNEMTRAEVTAVTIFQATLGVPGRVIPSDPTVERAVLTGEQRFSEIGCAVCHIPSLPLDKNGWVFTEPNPFNPPGNLRPGEAESVAIDLADEKLPGPRLKPSRTGEISVPLYTDFKLHDITDGPGDPNVEPLDMQHPSGSPGFFAGNSKFLTKRLWGCANEPPFFHHGQFTTMREAIRHHAGEASGARRNFLAMSAADQDAVIEFLKTLQILPPGAKHLICDENYQPRRWPPPGH